MTITELRRPAAWVAARLAEDERREHAERLFAVADTLNGMARDAAARAIALAKGRGQAADHETDAEFERLFRETGDLQHLAEEVAAAAAVLESVGAEA